MCHWLPWRERKTAFHPVIPWTPFLILEPKLKDVMVNAALKLLILHLPEFVPHPYGSSSSLHMCSVAKLYTILWCPKDCSPPGSSVHGTSQTRILEWVAISSPGHHPNPGIKPASLVLTGRFFTTEPPSKFHNSSLQLHFYGQFASACCGSVLFTANVYLFV